MRRALVLVLLLAACRAPGEAPPQDEARLVHLLRRVVCAPTSADLERLRSMGEERWLREQLHPGPEPGLEERFAAYATHGLEPVELYDYMAEHDSRQDALGEVDVSEAPIVAHMTEWRLVRAVESRYPLQEAMVDFWYDHFNVYWDKADLAYTLPQYVDQVIRPRALGNFRDLLGAVARSPAMQIYLDNWLSSAREEGGLNENYARELLELHTLGVEAGYTQQDVREVARCFTGWTINHLESPEEAPPDWLAFEFRFEPAMHDDGAKSPLGLELPSGGGERDGEAVLDLVASHPSTARRIARKLVRRFVDDEPPEAVVQRAAEAFSRSGGDIVPTLEAILTSPELHERRASKVKRPFEVVAGTLRVLGVRVEPGMVVHPLDKGRYRADPADPGEAMRRMGAPLYECVPPTGYPDTADAWDHAGSVQQRFAFARAAAERWGPGFLEGVGSDPEEIVAAVLPGGAGPDTRAALQGLRGVEALAVVLGSAEFQTR